MPLFNTHKHWFQESLTSPQILFCNCGEIKDIHRHNWEEIDKVKYSDKIFEFVLKCADCGEYKKTNFIH